MNDQATINDELKRKTFLEKLAIYIARECEPPDVIGLHGAWGAGKTSFLYQLQLRLSGICPQCPTWREQQEKTPPGSNEPLAEPNTHVVWFEAWRFQHEPNPVIALLHEMRLQLQWNIKFIEEIRKLKNVTAYTLLDKLEDFQKALASFDEAVNLFKIDPSRIIGHGERYERDHFQNKLSTSAIRDALNDAIKKLLGKDKQPTDKEKNPPKNRVVVLIDDLDRCDSLMAYRLLEGLKVYLNLDRCIFVLAYDPDALEASIRVHILGAGKDQGHEEEHAQMVVEYLEKICPAPWALPNAYTPSDFLSTQLKDCPWRGELVKLSKDFELLPHNPRRIKSFARSIRRFAEHAKVSNKFTNEALNEFEQLAAAQFKRRSEELGKQAERARLLAEPPSGSEIIGAVTQEDALPALVLVMSYT